MKNYNLNNVPPFINQDISLEESVKQEKLMNTLNDKIFNDENLKYFTYLTKVDNPIGIMSYLDFVEMETPEGIESDYASFSEPLSIGSDVPMKTISLQLMQQTIKQKTYQCTATLTREMIQDLNVMGIDAVVKTEAILINESIHGIWKELLRKIDTFAEKTYRKTWTKKELKKEKRTKWINKNLPFLERLLPKIFKGIYKKAVVITDKMNHEEAQRKILTNILGCSNRIAVSSRRGPANVMVCNMQLGTILSDFQGFIYNLPEEKILNTNGIPYKLGTIQNITIFVDPMLSWTDNSVTMFKIPKENNPSMKLLYLGAHSLQVIAEETMAPKLAIRLRYANLFVGNKEFAHNHYNKIYFKFEKNVI